MATKYWIVGGEYRDTSFREVVRGTQSLDGPFEEYDDALSTWRRLAAESTCRAHQRYTIAQETGRGA